jgi:GNAT superfamily N-acetyltransferase
LSEAQKEKLRMKVRKACESDIERIAQIDLGCFVGYILWSVKNGFRDATIAELEQVAIDDKNRGRGFAYQLIEHSFALFKEHVKNTGHKVNAVFVTTSEGNRAENLYKATLQVSRAALIQGYGDGNEIILYNHAVAQPKE